MSFGPGERTAASVAGSRLSDSRRSMPVRCSIGGFTAADRAAALVVRRLRPLPVPAISGSDWRRSIPVRRSAERRIRSSGGACSGWGLGIVSGTADRLLWSSLRRFEHTAQSQM